MKIIHSTEGYKTFFIYILAIALVGMISTFEILSIVNATVTPAPSVITFDLSETTISLDQSVRLNCEIYLPGSSASSQHPIVYFQYSTDGTGVEPM